ncbi:hypothetical protein D3C84_909660 [compost metagenome]
MTVQHRPRQYHLPFAAAAADADIGVLAIQQCRAVIALQQVEGLFGILRADHAQAAHGHSLITGRFQPVPQAAAVADRQGQIRFQRQRCQALGGTPLAALRVGAVIVDGFHQLPFRAGVGGAGGNGKQGKQAQRSQAQGVGGLAHGGTALKRWQRLGEELAPL